MNHKEKMLAGLPYQAWKDGLPEERLECGKKVFRYNHLEPQYKEEKDSLKRDILGKTGERILIEAPFYCDYGYNIEIGESILF